MRTVLALVLLAASAAAVHAQTEAPKKSSPPKSREEFMQRVQQTALNNLGKARCPNGENCAPATEAELKNPPLSLAETSEIVGRGIFSGGGFHCGMDWEKRNFNPMMDYWRNVRKKSGRELALIAMIHGIVYEQFISEFAVKGKCPDEMKADLEVRLDFKPKN
jgi:hypothetical protein